MALQPHKAASKAMEDSQAIRLQVLALLLLTNPNAEGFEYHDHSLNHPTSEISPG